MQNSDIKAFNNGLNVMREIWGLQPLSLVASEQYWDRLKEFSSNQFQKACQKLLDKSTIEFRKGFPLPGDFIEAMVLEPVEVTKRWPEELEEGPDSMIIKEILALMPPGGLYYGEEKANEMVTKMHEIVDRAFALHPRKEVLEESVSKEGVAGSIPSNKDDNTVVIK